MRLPRAFILNITPVLADITALSCLFALVTSSRGEGMLQIPLALFVICAAAMSLLNCILAFRERTILQTALANLLLAVLCEIILLPSVGNASGSFIYTACALLFIYPALRGMYLIRRPPSANTMMVYSQAGFFVIGCFLLLRHNEYFRPGWGLTVLCFVSQAMNFGLLLYLRSEERRSRAISAGGPERWLIFAFNAGVMIVLGAVPALFLLPETRAAFTRVLYSIVNALLWLLDKLISLLDYVLSLLFGGPVDIKLPSGGVGGPLPSGSISQKEFETNYFLIALFWLICAVVLIWLFRLIKARLRLFTGSNVRQIKDASPPFWRLIRKKLAGLGNRLHFYAMLLINYRTPAGVFVRMERMCKRRGCPRLPGQTPREFLEMIGSRTGREDVNANRALSDLAERLDMLCFQTGRDAAPPPRHLNEELSSGQIRAMLGIIHRNSPPRKKI